MFPSSSQAFKCELPLSPRIIHMEREAGLDEAQNDRKTLTTVLRAKRKISRE